MTDYIAIDLAPNVGRRQRSSFKNIYRFGRKAKGQKRWVTAKSMESMPLVSGEASAFDSDEDEIPLDDLTQIRKRPKNPSKELLDFGNHQSHEQPNIGKKSLTTARSDPFLNCDFLDLELKKDDTLQSLSIRYHCSISDIKRANNLISSQEFYALRKVKIPVKKYGLLTELLKSKSSESLNSDNVDSIRTINIGSSSLLSQNSPEEAAEFLRKMDKDLMKIVLSTKAKEDSYKNVNPTQPRIHPMLKDPHAKNHLGIKWSYLIVFILIVCVILPVVIILHMYHIKAWNVQHNSTSNTL